MKSSDELILAIDFGTQSVRAVLVDLEGNVLQISKTVIEPYFSAKPGWAEQYPEYFRDKMFETLQRLFNETEYSKDQIKAVTLTTQRSTLINLDSEGKSLRPAIIWLDERCKSQVDKFSSIIVIVNSFFSLAWQESAIVEYDSKDRDEYYTRMFNTYMKIQLGGAIVLIAFTKIAFKFFTGIVMGLDT